MDFLELLCKEHRLVIDWSSQLKFNDVLESGFPPARPVGRGGAAQITRSSWVPRHVVFGALAARHSKPRLVPRSLSAVLLARAPSGGRGQRVAPAFRVPARRDLLDVFSPWQGLGLLGVGGGGRSANLACGGGRNSGRVSSNTRRPGGHGFPAEARAGRAGESRFISGPHCPGGRGSIWCTPSSLRSCQSWMVGFRSSACKTYPEYVRCLPQTLRGMAPTGIRSLCRPSPSSKY